jgi:hypothetical protein
MKHFSDYSVEDYIDDSLRMCDTLEKLYTQNHCCEHCSMNKGGCLPAAYFDTEDFFPSDIKKRTELVKEAVEKVQKWGKENPKKTYKDIMLEHFPKTDFYQLCVKKIFGRDANGVATDYQCECGYKCKDCWNAQYLGGMDERKNC